MTNRRYAWSFLAWFAAYAVLLVLSLKLLDRHVVTGHWLRTAVALLPMLPGIGMLVLIMQRFRALDELEQRIMSDGIMFAFATTALVSFSYGFLERSAGAPPVSAFWVLPLLCTTWVAGSMLARLRYR